MTRPYDEAFLRELFSEEKVGIGFDLARTCITANIPSKYVAAALEVTPLTVFKWYHGSNVHPSRHDRIHAFLSLVRSDMDKGLLPATNIAAAKAYIQGMIDQEI